MNKITNNNNNTFNSNNNKNKIFDLTFNINQLPTHLIRIILSYYYNHCLSMYNYIEKKNKSFTGYKIKFRWMDLCLVCKFWMEMVMPYLPNTFYLMDSQQKLETYLNLVEYGGTFPRRFLKPTLLRVVKPPPQLKKHPFHINSLGIYINRYQVPHQDDSVVPEVIYQQIFKLSPDLKSLSFQTENYSMIDLYYILKSINDSTINLSLLSQLDLSNCWFNEQIFQQLCKLISSNNNIKVLKLNNTQFKLSNYQNSTLKQKQLQLQTQIQLKQLQIQLEQQENLLPQQQLQLQQIRQQLEQIQQEKEKEKEKDNNSQDNDEISFLNSLKNNKTIEKLSLNSTQLFFTNYSKLIGGSILDFLQYIFVESESIKELEILDTPISYDFKQSQLSKYSNSTFDNLLVPMQKNLKKISISIRQNDQFLTLLTNSIQSSKNINQINLAGSSLSSLNGISNLLNSLQHCQTLLKVVLNDVRFNYQQQENQQINHGDDNEDEEDNPFQNVIESNAFHNNQTISSRNISANQFEKFSFLYGTQSLTSINLSSIQTINEEEMISLFDNLKYSSQLKQLYLKRTRLTSKCLTSLTNLIREPNSSLELLHLGNNNFSSSISILLMAFQLSKTLTDIDISSNQLTNNEGLAVAKFIKESSIIRHLNISNSDFKLSALNQLGTALSINKSLVSLNLSNIHLGMLEVTYIIDGLVQHPTISLLNLSNCGSKEMIKTLEETSQLRCNIISSFYN